MSLYNALFGYNPLAGLCLMALNVIQAKIPRFRDAWLNEAGEIVIYTRTGGGNREYYDNRAEHQSYDPDDKYEGPFNEDLRGIPGFLRDEDDNYDCTYASFFFAVPPAWKRVFETLTSLDGAPEAPAQRWAKLLAEMEAGDTSSEEAKRALKLTEEILAQFAAGNGVVGV